MKNYLVTDQDETVTRIVTAESAKNAATEVQFEDYFVLVYELTDPVWFERTYVERKQ